METGERSIEAEKDLLRTGEHLSGPRKAFEKTISCARLAVRSLGSPCFDPAMDVVRKALPSCGLQVTSSRLALVGQVYNKVKRCVHAR
jgi:hypothetical protein